MWTIRLGELADVNKIHDIESSAARLFNNADLPESLKNDCLPSDYVRESIAASLVWVAVEGADTPIGFAVTEAFGSSLHLAEISVHPLHARQGIGRRLVATVIAAAQKADYFDVTLTTFEHLPWNGPFYSSCGFCLIEELDLSTRLVDSLKKENKLGLSNRVAMAIRLEPNKYGVSRPRGKNLTA